MEAILAPRQGEEGISLLSLDPQEQEVFVPELHGCPVEDGITAKRDIL